MRFCRVPDTLEGRSSAYLEEGSQHVEQRHDRCGAREHHCDADCRTKELIFQQSVNFFDSIPTREPLY